jgi:hypothetical protein
MSGKIKMSPVQVNWKSSNSELEVAIQERENLRVRCQVDLLTEESIGKILRSDFSEGIKTDVKNLEISFPVFAEVRFRMLNFWEFKYGDFEIVSENDELKLSNNREVFKFWAENSIHPDPGFYLVENSVWVEELDYGNIKSLNLKHYLITGYDSYLEVLAQDNFKLDFI